MNIRFGFVLILLNLIISSAVSFSITPKPGSGSTTTESNEDSGWHYVKTTKKSKIDGKRLFDVKPNCGTTYVKSLGICISGGTSMSINKK